MTQAHTDPPPERPEPTTAVGRRDWLRRSALLAGAAAGAAVVLQPSTAHAADGGNLVLGTDNAAESATALTVGGEIGSAAPALAIQNADGPALRMTPLSGSWPGQLQVGEIAGTELGPLVGVDTVEGLTTTYLVTGVDLANVPSPFPMEPRRVLNLRDAASRAEAIIGRSSSSALASDGRLRAGQWIDIALAFTNPDSELSAVFANLTVVGPTKGGYASLYGLGVKPPTSSLNFAAGQTIANAAFVGTGSERGFHAVRLYSSADAWYLLDVTGGVMAGNAQTPVAETARAAGGRKVQIERMRKALGRRSR